MFSHSSRDSEIRAGAQAEFHRRFHISVDETEGQGNQVRVYNGAHIYCKNAWIWPKDPISI